MNVLELKEQIGKDKEVYLMDLSWHLYRSYYSFGNFTAKLSTGFNKPTGHIYGVLRTLMQIKQSNPNAVVIFCVDGYPKDRIELLKQLNAGYKEGRSSLEYNIYQDVDILLDFCRCTPNTYSAYNPYKESDDLMYSLSKHLEDDNTVYVFSGDNDLLQAITENTSVVRQLVENKPVLINEQYLKDNDRMHTLFRGCPPKHLPIYRALVGDKSDGITGIPRLPKVLASHLAIKCDGDITKLQDPMSLIEDFKLTKSHIKYLDLIKKEYNRILINYKVMKLSKDIEFEIISDCLDRDNTYLMLTELHLNSYRKFLYELGV